MARLRALPIVIAARDGVTVERDPQRPSGRLLRQGQMDASYVDLADPGHLEFDYLRWIRIVLRAARARRVLHIGGAGCALARALAAEDAGSRQEVCEIDAAVLELAREHLGLRRAPGLRVRHAEGRSFAATRPDAGYDAVVLDAFVGAAVPRALITAEGLAEFARLAPLTLVNVVDDRSAREIRRIAAGLAESYPAVWWLGGRAGNTIVAGQAPAPQLTRLAGELAADASPARVTDPPAAAARIAGITPLRDDARVP